MYVDQLMLLTVEVLQGGRNMENSSPPEYSAAVGSYDGQLSIRYGIRVDGEWEYQRVHQGASGHEPI